MNQYEIAIRTHKYNFGLHQMFMVLNIIYGLNLLHNRLVRND